jgi:hypothetical protein
MAMTNPAYDLYRPKEIALVNAEPFACPALVVRLPLRLDYWDGARGQSGCRRADPLS